MRIGIDIGGTKVLLGLIDENGRLLEKRKIKLDTKEYELILERIIKEIERLGRREKIKKIGVAVAGQIEKGSGRILFSPNLKWHSFSIKENLEERLGIEVIVENDVNAATYGEWLFGLNGLPEHVIGVFIGTGIGGGIIIDRKLYRGFSEIGGEIGHMILNPKGYRCNCGRMGCFEAFCGGFYITERVKEKLKKGYRGKIYEIIEGKIENLHTGHIERAYLLGDKLCEEIWKEVIEYLAIGLANLINIFDPQVLLLGGGVVYGSRFLLREVSISLQGKALEASLQAVKILKAKLQEDAALLGVAFI